MPQKSEPKQNNTGRNAHLRQCAVCRKMREKSALIRIVRTPKGEVLADPGGKRNGRGLYLCADDPVCLFAAGKRRVIQKSLKCEAPESLLSELSGLADAAKRTAGNLSGREGAS